MAQATVAKMMGRLALLSGLFVVPVFLLWAGHQWRYKGARMRGAFWGGLIAHSVAALLATGAALYRPAEWDGGDLWRGFIGFWSMLVLFAIGAVAGAMINGRADRADPGGGE